MKKYWLLVLVAWISCDRSPHQKLPSIVHAEVSNAYNQWFFVEKLTHENDTNQWKDSVYIRDRVQPVQFQLPDSTESIYRIYSTDHRVDFVLVNDIPDIRVRIDYFDNGKFEFQQSPANIALHAFLQDMRQRATYNREQYKRGFLNDSMALLRTREEQQRYRNFVDTVGSPASALYVYSSVDFGSDREGLKSFISRLEKRFPDHAGVKRLAEETRGFLKIFEEDLNIGERAPELRLADTSGKIVTLTSFKGRYVLLDFWASWDPVSRYQQQFNRKAALQFGNLPFSVLSVSLDPEQPAWKSTIVSDKLSWTQVNDPKVWNGVVAREYKIDSIPFNFLIDPEGIIVGKAMYRDSLLIKLKALLK